jgi:hypothetical protein
MAAKGKYGGVFCNSDEQRIATLGTGYAANFIATGVLGAGVLERAGATLSDKRIYFSGKVFSLDGKGRLSSTKEQKIVAVRDVTGVGYKQYNPIHYIVAAIGAFIAGLGGHGFLGLGGLLPGLGMGCAFIVAYFVTRKVLVCIEYAGGNIAFDVRWFQSGQQDNFIRNIHLAKDKLYSVAAVEQGFVAASEPKPAPKLELEPEPKPTPKPQPKPAPQPSCSRCNGNEDDTERCHSCGEGLSHYGKCKKLVDGKCRKVAGQSGLIDCPHCRAVNQWQT